MRPLRLLIYDRTCLAGHGQLGRIRVPVPGLSRAWWAGEHLYRLRNLVDGGYGASSWEEALRFLADHRPDRAIGEVQFWGHGKWGRALIDRDVLSERTLLGDHVHQPLLRAVRARLSPDALWWFRTCETFGATRGQQFARAWSDFLGVRAAGHTYVIGFWQSGLHALAPGSAPHWSPEEGLREGSAAEPRRARASSPLQPNTISCLQGVLPSWSIRPPSAAPPSPAPRA